MSEMKDLQADVSRMAKLKELASAGMIDAQSSYFNHLIDVYGDLGRTSTTRTFTDRERERVDMFLESFAN
jgi:hypothetical protein